MSYAGNLGRQNVAQKPWVNCHWLKCSSAPKLRKWEAVERRQMPLPLGNSLDALMMVLGKYLNRRNMLRRNVKLVLFFLCPSDCITGPFLQIEERRAISFPQVPLQLSLLILCNIGAFLLSSLFLRVSQLTYPNLAYPKFQNWNFECS